MKLIKPVTGDAGKQLPCDRYVDTAETVSSEQMYYDTLGRETQMVPPCSLANGENKHTGNLLACRTINNHQAKEHSKSLTIVSMFGDEAISKADFRLSLLLLSRIIARLHLNSGAELTKTGPLELREGGNGSNG